MKKKLFVLAAIAVMICTIALCLCACGGAVDTVDKEGLMTLAVVDGDDVQEYSVDLSDIGSSFRKKSAGLMVILDYLKDKGELTYTSNQGDFGAYLTQINGIKQENGIFVTLYTDVESDIDVSEYATTYNYKEKTLTSSGVGASSMHIKKGCTIVITSFSYNG